MVNPAIQDKRAYVKIRPKEQGSGWCILEDMDHAKDIMDGEPGMYEIKEIWLTPAEYDVIKEFQGW